MFELSIKVESKKLQRSLEQFAVDVQTKVLTRAVNKTAAMAKTAASREIRAQGYNIKASAISKSLKIKRATWRDLTAIITVSGQPIPLIAYGARQVGSGVSVNVKNGRKIIKGAFIATMPSGHQGIFVRVGRGHKKVVRNGRVRWSGLPIKQLWGPSVPTAAANEAVQRAMEKAIKDKYPRLLAHEIRYALLQANK